MQAHAGLPGTDNSNDIIQALIPESDGIAYVSALVVGNTLWVFGTNDVVIDGAKSRTQVHTFWSSDPALSTASWHHSMVLQLPQHGPIDPSQPIWNQSWWTAFNTSPSKGKKWGSFPFFFFKVVVMIRWVLMLLHPCYCAS